MRAAMCFIGLLMLAYGAATAGAVWALPGGQWEAAMLGGILMGSGALLVTVSING